MKISRYTRQGTTLLELIVVLVIIGILASLVAYGVSRYIGVSQAKTTETTIRKAYTRLQSQRAAVMKAAEREDIPTTVGSSTWSMIQTAAGYSTTSPIQDWQARARIIYIKLRLKQEFPMSFSEALSPTPLPAKQAFVQAFSSLTTGQPYESSACLLAALQLARGGSSLSADEYGSTSVKSFLDPSTGAQVPALIDGWGNPLFYYRWPWGSTEVDALAPATQTSVLGTAATGASVVRDPEDPLGLLRNTTWYASAGRTTFEGWCHSVTNTSQPLTNAGYPQYHYYLIPVIVSAGPTGLLDSTHPNFGLGLSPQSFTASPGTWNGVAGVGPLVPDTTSSDDAYRDTDNIYSFRLMPPGARGD